MDRQEFYSRVDEILEVDAGTISGTTVLRELDEWTSLAVVSVIAMVDTAYKLAVPPRGIAQCKTAEDLARLVEQLQTSAVK